MHLLINYFKSGHPERQKEYDYCVTKNIMNKNIKHIHVFIENKRQINVGKTKKIVTVEGFKRTKFSDFFQYSSSLKGIIIIANLDIYFDKTISRLSEFVSNKQCVALSRHENKKGKWILQDRRDSQDVWAFKAPIANIKAKFLMGQRGCDNVLAGLLQRYYRIRNPARSIRAKHVHATGYRTYNKIPIVKGGRVLVDIEG